MRPDHDKPCGRPGMMSGHALRKEGRVWSCGYQNFLTSGSRHGVVIRTSQDAVADAQRTFPTLWSWLSLLERGRGAGDAEVLGW